jgi:hypothetical protein
VAGREWHRLLVVGSAIMIAGAGGSEAQQQRETQGEVVEPEVQQEAPPVMVAPADEAQEEQPGADVPAVADRTEEQLLTSLRRAEEALQNDDRKAAMQALMQAEEQLDEAAGDSADERPWQRMDLAVQEAMKALAEDNPRYALIALQRITGPAQGSDAGQSQDEEQPAKATSVLDRMPASDVIGAEVVDARGEPIAEIRDIVRDRAGGGQLYAILDVGGFLGIAEKEVALALDQLEIAEDDKLVLPGTTESQLDEMPTYSRDDFERLR